MVMAWFAGKQVEKAGATALFEEQGKGSNNIGVVVNPVRLSSLEDFGTPQFVADKLIQAERRKVISQFYLLFFLSGLVDKIQWVASMVWDFNSSEIDLVYV